MQDNAVDHVTIGEEMYRKLNRKQKEAVDAVLSGQERLIYLDGPGGSGKTFTYECIYHKFLSIGKKPNYCLALQVKYRPEKVGVFLPEDAFSHGQLYVAMSRAKTKDGLKIKIGTNKSGKKTANVVDSRALA